MAQKVLYQFQFMLSLAFAFLVCVVSTNAFAQDCEHIRSCSQNLHIFELKAASCRAEMNANHCTDVRADSEWAKHLRVCTPEAVCRETRDWLAARTVIPGCSGVSVEKANDVWGKVSLCLDHKGYCAAQFTVEFAKALVSLETYKTVVSGLVDGAVETASTVYNIIFHPVQTASKMVSTNALIDRASACFDNQVKYEIACQLAGGTFIRAAGERGAAKAVVKATAERSGARMIGQLATRDSVVTARESAGRGVRSSEMRAVRARAQAGTASATAVAVVASGRKSVEFAGGEKPKPTAAAKAAALDAEREEYMRRLLARQNTTVEERRAFAELAYKTKSDGHTVFLDLQNSKMKFLNDHLGNKNVVTAITNQRLQVTFDKLSELKTKYPDLQAISYDDFKSGRVAFRFTDGKVPAGFMDEVKGIMNTADAEYIAELEKRALIPEGVTQDIAKKAFVTGYGATGDEANAAARYASRTGQMSVDFRQPIVRANLEGRLVQADTERAGLMKAYRNTPFSEQVGSGQYIPSTNVFEAYRKSTDAADFRKLVQEKTGQSISAQSAQSLRSYLSKLDELSTGLLIVEKRQAVSFAGSKFNGVTIDVSGMGALNMHELAKSLVGVKDVNVGLTKARESERAATVIFEKNKSAIVESAQKALQARGIEADVRVSGDDIIVLPTNRALDDEALAALHESVAKSSSSSNVRISAVTPGAAQADQIAVRGEILEKKVRESTQTTVQDQTRYTLMVVSDAQGAPVLHVVARSGEVSPEANAAFQAAFKESLQH